MCLKLLESEYEKKRISPMFILLYLFYLRTEMNTLTTSPFKIYFYFFIYCNYSFIYLIFCYEKIKKLRNYNIIYNNINSLETISNENDVETNC